MSSDNASKSASNRSTPEGAPVAATSPKSRSRNDAVRMAELAMAATLARAEAEAQDLQETAEQQAATGVHKAMVESEQSETSVLLARDDREDKVSDSSGSSWVMAQAGQVQPEVRQASQTDCKTTSSDQCDDDKAAWWQTDSSWVKVGLGVGGAMLAAQLLKRDANEPPSELSTGLAAGPFKKNGMTLSYFGTSGLLLELSWDEQGMLTKTVRAALNGDVTILTSKVDTGTGLVDVVTGVEVDFANYTGTLMAVLWDKTDAVPVQFYDEVAGLIALEDTSLRAVTSIQKGPNYLAITPFTELALRKANVPAIDPANAAQITQLLNTPQRVTDINNANKELSTALGVTDIVKVLPVALNDQAFGTSTDAQSKLYGEKLASLSRLVPGNLDGGIDKLLNTAPADVPAVIAASLQDYRDDNNPQNPTTPPEVTIVRPWINAAEGRTPVTLRGSSENANEGSVVRITVLKNGVVLATLKTEVDADGHWQVPMPGTLASLGVLDGETLTIRAYIDPDHPASVDARYDATPPAAPQAPADMLASDDSANDSDDLTSQIRPGFQIGALPEEGMTVELLVDGVPVEATYNAQTGVIQPAQSLADGGRRITYRYIDFAGNVGPEGAPLQIVVDSQAPQAPASAPDLQAASDSGTSQSDNITSDQRPRFVVGAAPEQGLTVELVVDGEVVSATWDVNTGTLRPTEAMGHGSHTVAYRWVDAAGNASEAGPGLDVDIDTVAPGVRMANIDISADTGSSASDFVTRQSAQTVTGQINAPLSQGDRVFGSVDGGATWQEVTSLVNANGQLTWNNVQLSAGQNTLQFKFRDAAGNESVISSQAYNLDTTPPGIRAFNIAISEDTGSFNNDFVTKQSVQTVSGRLIEAGQLVSLANGELLMGSSDGGLTWQDITSGVTGSSFRWNNATLSNGTNSLRFKVIDQAGNEGTVIAQNYTLDTVSPAAPETFSWATYPNGISSSSNSVSGSIGQVPFTYTLTGQNASPLNLNSSGNLANHSFFPTGFGVPNQTSIRNDYASVNTLTFDSPMSNLVLAFSSIGNPSTPVSINFPQPVEILWSTGYGNGPDVRVDVGTRSAATQITGWEGNMVVRFNGTVDQFVFNYLSNETYVNFAFGASVFDLLAPEQDTGIKSIDDNTQVTRPAFNVQNKPSDAVSAELLINGQLVAATFNATDNTLTPNLPLSDGVYQVSYRFIDLAGNASAGGSVTTVTIDTRAPVNTSLTTFTPDAIGGNYEPGTTLSLKVNGVSINANRLVLNATNGTWSFVPTQSELTQAGTGLLNKATSTFDLTATDLAGNETVASKTVSKDVFNAPYVKEFIPTDGGILANDSTGHATLNLVFSKAVRAGTGKIKLFDVSNDALVAEIDVTSNAVRIEGNDLYVTLPALSTGTRYYVTLDNGTFVDSAGQAYVGKSETGTAGWDFTGALASIAPDFVAQDDIVNANESAAVVRITGKVVSSVAVLEDILAGDLSVNVTVPQGAAAVTATLQSYNNQTGEFVFTVPAQAWANGNYGYTVSLHGSTGDAASVTASYNFANLAVDLLAPSGILGSIDAITDNQGQLQGNLISTPSLKLLESTFASSVTPVIKLTDTNVADLDLTKLSATMGGAWINNGSNTLKGITDVLYNTASTVYNSDRTSVTFWLQTRDGATGLTGLSKAIKVELKDSVTANGIELRVIDAAYKNYASTDLSFNWNNSGAPKQQGQVATSFAAGGYGLLGLEYVGDKISAAGGFSDDDTPSLTGSLTRALAQGERIAIDRTDGQGNTITVTGKAGLVVDGTTWIFNDGALVDGQYTYRVYVEDGAGNRTASSAARSITVDTQAPTVTVTAASLSQDTGISNTDRLTKVAVQTITGTLSAALGSGEKLMASLDGGTTFVDITSMVSGTSFNWAGATLPQGASSIRWQVVDAAGNTGPGWDLSVNLDTAGPDAPVTAPDLLAADDDGNSDSDNATSISKPRFVVGPLPSGTSGVELLVNGLPVTAQYDASTQTLTPALDLANGSNLISYRYIDAAGNSGVASPSLTLRLQPLGYVPLTIATVYYKNSTVIAGLGDVNGDGFSDIEIDSMRRYNSQETADLNFIMGASSFTSPITSLKSISSSLISRPNNIPSEKINRVSPLGDINNDGLNDYVMATSIDPYSGFWYEGAYVNFGSKSSIATPYDFKIFSSRIGNTDGYPAGLMTTQAGDMNGDGFNDILVNFNHLGTTVILGGTGLQNITQLDVAQLNSPPTQANSSYGFNYLSTFQTVFQPLFTLPRTSYTNAVGDFNGDGYADMALVHEGDTAYVIFGRSSASSKAMSMTLESSVLKITGLAPMTSADNGLAYRNLLVARMPQYLGDVNGDGYADFAFTNYGYDGCKGQLVVVFGGTNTKALSVQNLLDQPGQRGFVIRNAEGIADDILGYSATYAGDVNGDGISDFAFGAPGIGTNNQGRVYIVYGRQDFSNFSLADVMQGRGGNVLNGSGTDMNLGQSLSFGGDINGDGLGELLIGSRNDGLIVLGSNTFSESKITQVGTSAADTLSDGGSSKTLIGGMGNDTLSATGVSVLSGGAGDDTFVIGQAMALALQSPLGLGGNTERLAKVDGGTGVDTLQLSGTDLDLRLVANQAGSHSYGGSRIDGIEVIDMGSANSNTLKLTVFDLIDMGSANTFETTARQQLLVKGGAGDTVQLMDTNATGVWTLASGTVTIGGEQYHVLNHNTAAASLYVKDGVAVTGFVAGAPAAPPPSYISIGRLDADGTAFGAWFDTDQNGVKDAGEVMIEANVHIDMVAENYTYSLKGVDFATGSYTVRFVDVVMHNFDKLDIPGELFRYYAHLDMGSMHFGTDDKVIIDMKTNANDWMGMDVRDIYSVLNHPAASYGNNTLGTYADGVYGARTSSGLFGQLEAGTRPSDSFSRENYARLDMYVQDQNSTMVSFNAIQYFHSLTQPTGGTRGISGDLVDLGVPITTENLEFILPTTFIV